MNVATHARLIGGIVSSEYIRQKPRVFDGPLVTVVIATYNRSEVLRYALASALGQTYRRLEVLVVGDACTDDSERVVAGFGDPRVTWTNLEEARRKAGRIFPLSAIRRGVEFIPVHATNKRAGPVISSRPRKSLLEAQ